MAPQKTILPEPLPTQEEWQKLYAAAKAFKQAKPWNYVAEEKIFGIRNPETGQVGYCSITGSLGEHLALNIYDGEVGLGGYFELLERHFAAQSPLQQRDASLSITEVPQLQASFEDRDTLHKLDRQIIKDLGLRFRGHCNWPLFRHFQPGRIPWFITAPQARFLTTALEQALIVAQECDEDDLFVLEGETEETLNILIRSKGHEHWTSHREDVTPLGSIFNVDIDEATFTAARRELPQRKAQLQVHFAMMGSSVEEGPLPPYFPYILLFVDADSGFVLAQDMILAQPSLEAILAELPLRFLAQLYAMRMRPEEIQVSSERLYQLLAVAAGYLGVQLVPVTSMPMLEDALASLEEWLMM